MTLIFMLINFVVFAAVLFVVLRKPIKKSLTKRKESFIEESKEAESAFSEANKKLNELKLKLKNAETDGKVFIKQAIDSAKNTSDNMAKEAKRYSEYLLEESKRVVEAEKRSANQRIKGDFVSSLMGDLKTDFLASADTDTMKKYVDGARTQ
ncbi:MAG: hypothetical protein V1647_01130 [Pseudomonadota bacterium]